MASGEVLVNIYRAEDLAKISGSNPNPFATCQAFRLGRRREVTVEFGGACVRLGSGSRL